MRKKLANKFKYFKEKKMTIWVLLCLLMMNILIILLGCLVLKMLPENKGLSITDTLWESLRLVLDPGGFLGSKLSAITTIVTSAMVLLGMVTFTGGIIGYVTNVITTKIEDSKKGVGGLSIDNYTLILNWNKRAMAIILDRYADKSRDNINEYIVVLSKEDKVELEKEIKSALKYFKENHVGINKNAPRVIVRNGDPTKPDELFKINYMDAKPIFIMQPKGCIDPDYMVLKTLYSLCEELYTSWELEQDVYEIEDAVDVIVETSDAATCEKINNTILMPYLNHGYYPHALNKEFTIGKILAQVAIMPEMGDAYKEIASLSGAVIQDLEYDEEEKMTFDERMLKYAFTIPVFERVDEDGEKSILYVTSESKEDCFTELDKAAIRIEDKKYKLKPDTGKFDTHTIIICGINKKLPYILNAIRSNNELYPNRKCMVTQVVDNKLEEVAKKYCTQYSDIINKSPLVIERYFNSKEVVKLIDSDFHSMLVLSNEVENEEQKDKNVFELWLGLTHEMDDDEELFKRISGKVILEIEDDSNSLLVKSGSEKHLVIGNEITSLFMNQMSQGETVYDNLMDMLCTKNDVDYEGQNFGDQYDCNLMSIRVKDLFETDKAIEFLGKQDLIYNVYKGTENKIVPVGCVIDGLTYFFTNGNKADPGEVGAYIPTLSDGLLISGIDGGVYMGYLDDENQIEEAAFSPEKYLKTDSLSLKADDYIIACVKE